MSLPFDFFVGNVNLRNTGSKLNFSFSKGINGDENLAYDVPGVPPALDTPVMLRDSKYGYFWGGYTWQPTLSLWDCVHYQCRGNLYTAEDNSWNEKKVFVEGTPLSRIVDEAITKCGSRVFQGNIPGGLAAFQITEDTENFGLNTAKALLEFVQRQYAFLATPLQWRVGMRGWGGVSYLDMEFADYSPRYRVMLTRKDDFKPIYDADAIFNAAMFTWGNDQYATATAAGVVPNTAIPDSLGNVGAPNTTIPTPYDTSVIQRMRVKRVRADESVKKWADASAMGAYLVQRNSKLRPIGFTATIDCDTPITAVPPVVSVVTDNFPHHMVEPWHGIRILNDLRQWGVFGNIDTFYIIGMSWSEDGKLTLTLGDPLQLDAFRIAAHFSGNKLNEAIKGAMQLPEHDYNGYPTVGPFYDAQGEYLNNGVEAAMPMFAVDSNPTTKAPNHDDPDEQFYLPFGAGVHPHEIPDYGTQANFGREGDSTGIKGFIGLIPCKLLKWYIAFLPPPGSDVIPTDTITLEFYDKYPFIVGTDTPFATKSISPAAQQANGDFTGTQRKAFAQGGQVGIRVSAAMSTSGSGFLVFLGGRKLFPDLGVTT